MRPTKAKIMKMLYERNALKVSDINSILGFPKKNAHKFSKDSLQSLVRSGFIKRLYAKHTTGQVYIITPSGKRVVEGGWAEENRDFVRG